MLGHCQVGLRYFGARGQMNVQALFALIYYTYVFGVLATQVSIYVATLLFI
jgi:hypothetical protein